MEGYSLVSDRIILAKFTTMVGCLVVIQVYAPTTAATQQEVDSFYTLLQSAVNEQKDGAFLILMGDFNAKLGTDWENAGGAIGRFIIGDINEAGEQTLIQFANANRLLVTNTCFRQVK